MHKRLGFTLIELSIVLVIIGLLASGILVGSDLMMAARVRAQATQIEKINTATMTFRLKFNCLPGDCADAVALGLGVAGGDGDSGNGNAIIEILPSGIIEHQTFWTHLGNANLIEGKYTTGRLPGVHSPALKLPGLANVNGSPGGFWIASAEMGANVLLHGYTAQHSWLLTATTQNFMGNGGVYNGNYMYMLDSKIDDGMPLEGSFWAVGNHGLGDPGYCVGAVCLATFTTADGTGNYPVACIDDSALPQVYNIRNTSTEENARCSAIIKAPF
jgi:prepilin-type N-terminal cleavage/methylation domain-containing protein